MFMKSKCLISKKKYEEEIIMPAYSNIMGFWNSNADNGKFFKCYIHTHINEKQIVQIDVKTNKQIGKIWMVVCCFGITSNNINIIIIMIIIIVHTTHYIKERTYTHKENSFGEALLCVHDDGFDFISSRLLLLQQ